MPELIAILSAKRDEDYQQRRFFAALQGVDLDENSGGTEEKGQKELENLKARVFTGGSAQDSNDVISLQGINSQQAGFGIGNGLEYENLTKDPINPFG